MRKLMLTLIIGVFLIGTVAAVSDVAYVVASDATIKSEFLDALDRVGLSHDIIYSNQIQENTFLGYRMLLMNDEHFNNWQDIPVNEMPAMIVNGRNIVDWGWTEIITASSTATKMKAHLNTTHEIKGNLPFEITLYEISKKDVYYLAEDDQYDGLEIVLGDTFNNKNAIVAVAHEGTTLTRGAQSTEINANGVFFGIYNTAFWTDQTRQLFDNALLWLAGEETPQPESFTFGMSVGENLISFPLALDPNGADSVLNGSSVETALKYNSLTENFSNATTFENNEGYFLFSDNAESFTINGLTITEEQNVDLREGINLVGIVGLESMSLDNLPSEVIEVSKRNSDGSYTVATRYPVIGWYNDIFELEPGIGYWFKLNSDTTWTYTPTGTQ